MITIKRRKLSPRSRSTRGSLKCRKGANTLDDLCYLEGLYSQWRVGGCSCPPCYHSRYIFRASNPYFVNKGIRKGDGYDEDDFNSIKFLGPRGAKTFATSRDAESSQRSSKYNTSISCVRDDDGRIHWVHIDKGDSTLHDPLVDRELMKLMVLP